MPAKPGLEKQMGAKKQEVSVDFVQSSSNATVVYEVKTFVDGSHWCNCAAFKFQKVAATERCCKHTKSVVAMNAMQAASAMQLKGVA